MMSTTPDERLNSSSATEDDRQQPHTRRPSDAGAPSRHCLLVSLGAYWPTRLPYYLDPFTHALSAYPPPKPQLPASLSKPILGSCERTLSMMAGPVAGVVTLTLDFLLAFLRNRRRRHVDCLPSVRLVVQNNIITAFPDVGSQCRERHGMRKQLSHVSFCPHCSKC